MNRRFALIIAAVTVLAAGCGDKDKNEQDGDASDVPDGADVGDGTEGLDGEDVPGDTPSEDAEEDSELPTPPAHVNESVPLALSDIIVRCLAKDPEQRFQKVDELLQELPEVAF